ncbi:MAG: HIT domain-containing protein [Rickettsiales bacterium]
MSNIFLKIINNEIPSVKIYEDDLLICIKDINPLDEIHFLCIPKKPCIDYLDFIEKHDEKQISNFFIKISLIAKEHCSSFKLITNNGAKSGQEIFQMHMHIIGKKLINK